MTRHNGHYDAPSDAELEAAAERLAEQHAREEAERDRYLEWMAERAERAIEAAPDEDQAALHDALDTINLDFSKVGPRGRPELQAIMDRYALSGEMDGADLLALDIHPPRVICEGILSAGTTVLASLPKLGKSWMCLQMAVECVLGGTFLERDMEQGSVLYLPLEDGRGRTQNRLRKVLQGRKLPPGKLSIRWDAPPLGDGMEGLIEGWLDAHPDAAMVIVDTLGRVRTPGDGKRNAYQVDVQDVGRLQSLVRDRAVALVLVHHTKKGKEDDFVAQVSGTLGIAGSADTILVLNRKRLAELATLEVTSRELPEQEVGCRFVDGEWVSAPEAMAAVSAPRLAVYDAIKLHGPLWPVGIARILRAERTSVQHLVNSLLQDGLIERGPAGYVIVEDEPPIH